MLNNFLYTSYINIYIYNYYTQRICMHYLDILNLAPCEREIAHVRKRQGMMSSAV